MWWESSRDRSYSLVSFLLVTGLLEELQLHRLYLGLPLVVQSARVCVGQVLHLVGGEADVRHAFRLKVLGATHLFD